MEFKKEFKFKILSLLFAGIFFVTSAAYGIDLPEKSHLRKPLSFNTSVNGDGLKRSEEAKNRVDGLSKLAKKAKLLAKLKRKIELAIALGLSVTIGGIIYLVNHPSLDESNLELKTDSIVLSQDERIIKELEKDSLLMQPSRILPEVRTAYNELKKLYRDDKNAAYRDDLAECTKISDFFRDIRNDKEYSEIYKMLDFANLDFIQTVQFQDAARFLSANTDYYDWVSLPYIFWTTLEISKDFEAKKEEWKEIVGFLKTEGNLIEVKDYYFLNMVVKSPRMMAKLKDRKGLESRISEIYADNQPVRREAKAKFSLSSLMDYDERQDPSTLPSVALLYAITLYDSFNSEEFQRNIGEVFQKDLNPDDGIQEHGGFFKFDVKREILLPIEVERLKTMPRDQASWDVDENIFPDQYLRPSFHLHATSSDNREDAGPSLSDMGMVSLSGKHRKSNFNAVFTAIGFKRDEHFLVNLDVYGLTNRQYFVVDVGTQIIKISISDSKKSVVPNDSGLERQKGSSVDSSMLLDLNEDTYRAVSSGL